MGLNDNFNLIRFINRKQRNIKNFNPYLTVPYGAKVEVYLQREARTLLRFTEHPNPQVG